MNAYDIAEQFDSARVTNDDGEVVYANVWTPAGKDWSRIYFSTSRKKNEGKDYGYIFVGNDVDFGSLRSGCDAIGDTVNEILAGEAPEATPGGGEDIPF